MAKKHHIPIDIFKIALIEEELQLTIVFKWSWKKTWYPGTTEHIITLRIWLIFIGSVMVAVIKSCRLKLQLQKIGKNK